MQWLREMIDIEPSHLLDFVWLAVYDGASIDFYNERHYHPVSIDTIQRTKDIMRRKLFLNLSHNHTLLVFLSGHCL